MFIARGGETLIKLVMQIAIVLLPFNSYLGLRWDFRIEHAKINKLTLIKFFENI